MRATAYVVTGAAIVVGYSTLSNFQQAIGDNDDERSVAVAQSEGPSDSRNENRPAESSGLKAARGELHIVPGAVVNRAYWPGGAGPEGVMGVWGEPATADILQAFTAGMASETFESEPIDSDWAPEMTATIQDIVNTAIGDAMNIREVECRMTACRAIVDHGEVLQNMDQAARQAHFDGVYSQLVDSFTLLVSDPNGRLRSWTSSVRSSVDGDVSIYTLTGP